MCTHFSTKIWDLLFFVYKPMRIKEPQRAFSWKHLCLLLVRTWYRIQEKKQNNHAIFNANFEKFTKTKSFVPNFFRIGFNIFFLLLLLLVKLVFRKFKKNIGSKTLGKVGWEKKKSAGYNGHFSVGLYCIYITQRRQT